MPSYYKSDLAEYVVLNIFHSFFQGFSPFVFLFSSPHNRRFIFDLSKKLRQKIKIRQMIIVNILIVDI